MGRFLVFPDPLPEYLRRALEAVGASVKATSEIPSDEEATEGFEAAVAYVGDQRGLQFLEALRSARAPLPALAVVEPGLVAELELVGDGADDFALAGASQLELAARLRRLSRRSGKPESESLIVYGPLALNVETYQAAVDGRPLDLTFMEYELLKFLATEPGKVFSRETLLQRVWGYEYFGGARTVDVHVRRLRAKLGEEHASLIETVRSVGYRFGSVRWLPGA